MKFMTDTQCAYIAGQKEDMPLGGVGCHAYFEFHCKGPDLEKLAEAWKRLFYLHKELRCYYKDGVVEEMKELPDCANMKVLDYRGKDPLEFRNSIESRNCNTKEGECCGLWYLITEKEYDILVFDWSLIAGDVKSFVLILDELAQLYAGESPDTADSDSLMELRKKQASTTGGRAKEIITQDLEHYVPESGLKILKTPEELTKCHYKSVDRWINGIEIKSKLNDGNLMAAFAKGLCEITGEESLVLNYPCFYRNENEWKAVGDFTDIKLMPMTKEYDKNLEIYRRYMEFQGFSHGKVRRMIGKKYPKVKNIAPVVFSPVMDHPLVTTLFEENIGILSYMISQTPQVWLDVQSFLVDDCLYISIVYPKEMFLRSYVEEIADCYMEKVKELV
ncbi:MAG: hypothetical protein K6A30_00465 [Lachnospiraceae bacterium]|nr:hypothetical protein [Lachnospiraceae bacterium]